MPDEIGNILLTNCLPSNAGDQGILEGTLYLLKKLWPESRIHLSSSHPSLALKSFPNQQFLYELDRAYWYRKSNHSYPVKWIIKKLLNIVDIQLYTLRGLCNKKQIEYLTKLEKADLVIYLGGSYWHDHYDLRFRFKVLSYALSLSKKIVFLGHSLGPFNKKKTLIRINSYFQFLSGIILREHESLKHLQSLQLSNVHVTGDLSFYLLEKYDLLPKLKASTKSPLRLVMNIRKWKNQQTNDSLKKKYIELITRIIVNDPNSQIHFISTCQGLDGYIDDSFFAEELLAELHMYRDRIFIDHKHRNPEEIVQVYRSFDAYLGMRLHGALFSLFAGTAAMCIAYEDKAHGIFESMGLGEYVIPYQEGIEFWFAKLDYFFSHFLEYQERIKVSLCHGLSCAKENEQYLSLIQDNTN